MRRFEGSRRTGRPGGDGYALQIEGDEQGLRLEAVEADVAGIWDPLVAVAVDRGAGHLGEDPRFEVVAQQGNGGAGRDSGGHCQAGSDAEAREGGNVLGAGPPIALLLAAREAGRETHAAANPQ